MEELEEGISSISIRKTQKKISSSFKISTLLQKKLKQIAYPEGLAVLKEFTVKASESSISGEFWYNNDYY